MNGMLEMQTIQKGTTKRRACTESCTEAGGKIQAAHRQAAGKLLQQLK